MFGQIVSKYDESVEKATAETLTEENWSLMLDISDQVLSDDVDGTRWALHSLRKRLNHRDPHVVLYALSLLDCLWNNAGVVLRQTVSSKDFVPQVRDLAKSSVTPVSLKTCTLVKKWAENECSKDASLSMISSLYKELKTSGARFEDGEPRKKKTTTFKENDEDAELAKAIALSLKDVKQSKSEPAQSYYPSISQEISAPTQSTRQQPQSFREVKALYDFEAVEENELSFKVGDVITVLEDSDPNWWKGQSHRGVGLFPSSFVANADATEFAAGYNNGSVHSETPVDEGPVQIDEEPLLKCIRLLEECDPTGDTPDPPALAYFENLAMQMAPLINKKLADIDRQHNSLANVDVAMRDVLASYDQAVQQVQYQPIPQAMPNYGNPYPGASNGPQNGLQAFPGFPMHQQQQQQQNPTAFPGYPPQGIEQHGFPQNAMYAQQFQQQQQPQQQQLHQEQQQSQPIHPIPCYPPQGAPTSSYAPSSQGNAVPLQAYPSQATIPPPQTPLPQGNPQAHQVTSLPQFNPQEDQPTSQLPPQAVSPQLLQQQQQQPQQYQPQGSAPPMQVIPQSSQVSLPQQSKSQIPTSAAVPIQQQIPNAPVTAAAVPIQQQNGNIPTSVAVPYQQQVSSAPTAAAAPFIQSQPSVAETAAFVPSSANSYAPSPVVPQQPQQQQHVVAPQPAVQIQPSPIPIMPQQQQAATEVRQTSPAVSVAPQPQPAAQFVHPQPHEPSVDDFVPDDDISVFIPTRIAPVQPSQQIPAQFIAEPIVAVTPPTQPHAIVEPQQEARIVDLDDSFQTIPDQLSASN